MAQTLAQNFSRANKTMALTPAPEFALFSVPLAERLMYAVLETGSKQYRVSAGDTLEIELLAVKPGQPVTFERVLLVNNDGKLAIGSPTVANAAVVADVIEHVRGKKKIAFKMKRRKGYHKTIGHRQELTVVKIKEIRTEANQAAVSASTPEQESTPAVEQPTVSDH